MGWGKAQFDRLFADNDNLKVLTYMETNIMLK